MKQMLECYKYNMQTDTCSIIFMPISDRNCYKPDDMN